MRFGDVTVRLGTRTLERAGRDVHVSPKAFDLLSLLLTHRPDVVRTEAIHRQLWPDVHVGSTSLPALIAEIRAALGESAREPRSIRTVPRVGYAFVADVAAEDDPSPAAARLWLIAGDRRIGVSDGISTLGREGPGVLEFPEATVSRQHARLHVSAREISIEDLGSKNGTWLHGSRVTERTPLSDGDRIMLGSVELVVSTRRPQATTQTLSDLAHDPAPGSSR